MDQPSPIKKETNTNNNKPALNQELLFFKNEILGDLKQLENKLLKKIEQKTDSSQKKIVQFETSLDALTKKVFNISNFFSENITMKDKIDNLFQSRTKMEETIYTHEYKLSSISKDLVTAINKYDKIIEKSIFYPGLIGASNARFNTFHNFIDFVMANISQLNHFKDKTMGIDLKQYKNKLEATIEGFKKQTEEIITNNKVYTSKLIKNLENKFKNDFELYDQRLFNLKIKNTEQIMGFEKLSKNLFNELNGLTDLKKNIEKSYETSIQVLRWHYIYTENKMNQCIKDYGEVKRIMDLLMEALKGMKGGSIPSLPEILKEYGNIGDKKDQNKKIKAESLLKKYIVGEMDMEQIAQLSKKSSSKVTFNDKNSIKSNIFEDNSINSSGNKKGKFSRLNTRSFIKYDSNRLSFNRDSQSSDIKSNNINLFSSQRIDFSKKQNEFGTKFSSNINFRSNKNNNSALDDKVKTIRRMETTFFNDRKFLKLNEPKTNISPRDQMLDLKNNKNVFVEKFTLNEESPQKSSLWSKGQKNNIYNNKFVNIIKESASEYNTEFNKTDREKKEEDKKEEPKFKKITEEKKIKSILSKEEKKNLINEPEQKNLIINNNIPQKTYKNKDIKELKISPRGDKQEVGSNLDNQTILSTITEHNILTPRGEDEKQNDRFENIDDDNQKNLKENLNANRVIQNIKSAPNIKKEKIKSKKRDKGKEKSKEKENETKAEKVLKDKKNNTHFNLVNYEFNSRNEDVTNVKNVHLPSNKTFSGTNRENNNNNFIIEIKNKTQENNYDDKGNDIISINTGSKIGLQKLLKGDRNAFNSFKLVSNGEDIKIPKIPKSEYEIKNNKNIINNNNNIISSKSRTNKDFKSASSTNFFTNKNKQINNNNKFDIFENLFDNNIDDFFNNYVENTDFNNLNPFLEPNFQISSNKNKKSKVHIVNIPALPQSHRFNMKNKEYSKDALNRIEALRKIKNDNNVVSANRNRINKSNENIRDKQKIGKLKLNNKLIRTYEGFNM